MTEQFQLDQLRGSIIKETLLILSNLKTSIGMVTFQTYTGADWMELRYQDANPIGLFYLSHSDYFSDRNPLIRDEEDFARTVLTLTRLIDRHECLGEIPGYVGNEF